ncbi:MAG: hypothetical protein MZV49_11680 [Rhodopseudomonas palustris]|nr:hypothetical protein [Rhodopseudomonas palustris]
MAAVGLLVLAPHLWWLVHARFPDLRLCGGARQRQHLGEHRRHRRLPAGQSRLYRGAAAGELVAAASQSPRRCATLPGRADPDRRLVVLIQVLLIALPAPAALPLGAKIVAAVDHAGLDAAADRAAGLAADRGDPRRALRPLVAGTALFTLALLAAVAGRGAGDPSHQPARLDSNMPRCWRSASSSNGRPAQWRGAAGRGRHRAGRQYRILPENRDAARSTAAIWRR